MKKTYLIIIGIILLIFVGVICFLNKDDKQDEILVSAIKTYLESNKQIINDDTILITSINNLKNENILDSSYENKILKITNKNKKIKFKVLDNYTFKKENYSVLEVNADNVNSKSFFYSDTNYRYYIDNANNYFIKQNTTLIPLYDIINNNYMTMEELINIVPLDKIPNIPTGDNNDSQGDSNLNEEEKENNNKEEINNNQNDTTNSNDDIMSKPNNENNSSSNTENGNNNLTNDKNENDDSNNNIDVEIPENEDSNNNVDINIPDKDEQNNGGIIINSDFKIEDRTGNIVLKLQMNFGEILQVFIILLAKEAIIFILFLKMEKNIF